MPQRPNLRLNSRPAKLPAPPVVNGDGIVGSPLVSKLGPKRRQRNNLPFFFPTNFLSSFCFWASISKEFVGKRDSFELTRKCQNLKSFAWNFSEKFESLSCEAGSKFYFYKFWGSDRVAQEMSFADNKELGVNKLLHQEATVFPNLIWIRLLKRIILK